MAAAFFLLSGSVDEAVGVLARERSDPQLALLVARLAEGEGSSSASKLVNQVGTGCKLVNQAETRCKPQVFQGHSLNARADPGG